MLILVSMAAAVAAAPADAGTIVVTAERTASRVIPPVVELDEQELRARQPTTAAESVDALNGVSVRINSRGEAVARIRGSEERQASVFLDGAPLAVPWDGRADLSTLPAGLIGSVRAIKGAAPLEFGTNSAAGAVELTTKLGKDAPVEAAASLGALGFRDASAVGWASLGGTNFTFAGAAFEREAEPVASRRSLPFSQDSSTRRTNTDAASLSVYGSAASSFGPAEVRLSLLHVQGERGIAPEGDRDPQTDVPRYWRYPDISLTQVTGNALVGLGPRSSIKLVGWRQWFDQEIVQFSSADYNSKRGGQMDVDDTVGGRVLLAANWPNLTLRVVGTAQTSRHAQRDAGVTGSWGPTLVYRQNLYTSGVEGDVALGPGRATLSVGYDRSANPRTGDKPAQPAQGAAAFSAAYAVPLSDTVLLTLSGGRRNRFPTARELFGEALGRFLPNADLKPEQSWIADVELSQEGPLDLVLNPFFIRTTDTISQRVVAIDGRSLRQRFNLSGSTSIGLDALAAGRLSSALQAELSVSLLRALADRGAAAFRQLPQRPAYEIGLALNYRPSEVVELRSEFRRFGKAADIDRDGSKARLPAGGETNLRGNLLLARNRRGTLALTASIENLFDQVIVPQLGLPSPGRRARIGLRLN